MQSEKSDQGRFRTHQEIDKMVERIKIIQSAIQEKNGYQNILSNFILDLVNYPEVKCVFDETREWIIHKPERLEDYLLGVQSLTQFVLDVKRDGIRFFFGDLYKEDCEIAKKITNQYYIFKGSKAIYWLAYLVNNRIVKKDGDFYIGNPALIENDFTY